MTQRTKLFLYFAATMSVYALMLGLTLPELHRHARGLDIFDIKPLFDYEYAVTLLDYLGEEGRAYYQYRQIPLDMLYIALFGFTYYRILRRFTALPTLHKWRFTAWLPIAAAVFDCLENICVFQVLHSFPAISPLIGLIPYLTVLKMTFSLLYLAAFFILGAVFLHRRLRKHSAPTQAG